MLAVYRTRVSSRGPGESIARSWRPRAKFLAVKDKGHDTLGWRHGVGLLEKYSRPCGLLIFRRRHRGQNSHCATKSKPERETAKPNAACAPLHQIMKTGVPHTLE